MKVLFLNHETALGGAELMLLRFLQACDRDSFTCELMVPKEGPLIAKAEKVGIRVHQLRIEGDLLAVRRKSSTFSASRSIALLRTAAEIRRFLRVHTPDVVVSNSIKSHVYGSIALRNGNIPYCWRFHDIVDQRSFSSLQRQLIYALARRYPLSIAGVSEAVCRPLRSAGVKAGRLSVIHNGIEIPLPSSDSAVQEFRSSLGLHKEHFVVTLPGRIMPSKGHEVLIEAARRVLMKLSHARFLIVGDPFYDEFDYRAFLESLICTHRLEQYILFTGFREEMSMVYAASDVVVLPSLLPDSFPTVILEAMAAERAVVASDGGGVAEIITDGEDGFIVEAGNAHALAEKLLEIASNSKVRGQLTLNARTKVASKFSLTRYVERLQSWLQAVHVGNRSPESVFSN